jgi:hypothetical protein
MAGIAGVKPSATNGLGRFFLPLPLAAHQALASIEKFTDLPIQESPVCGF